MGEASLGAAVAARVLGVLGLASRPAGDFRRPPALNLRGGWLSQRAGGPRRRYWESVANRGRFTLRGAAPGRATHSAPGVSADRRRPVTRGGHVGPAAPAFPRRDVSTGWGRRSVRLVGGS